LSPHAQALEAWARTSRFHSVGVVLDLEDDDAPAMLRALRSTDALDMVRLARRLRHRFVVLAGQLMRKKAGAFGATLAEPDALPLAALAAAERIGGMGESFSMWFVLVDEPARGAVMGALARYQQTEGTA
jgi:hypothetical protein